MSSSHVGFRAQRSYITFPDAEEQLSRIYYRHSVTYYLTGNTFKYNSSCGVLSNKSVNNRKDGHEFRACCDTR